ncbi:MAG: hypothetical protein II877_05045 [Synergistaceae bacterium]|nr:hypothetical protein [Synergistaceae bacterium]
MMKTKRAFSLICLIVILFTLTDAESAIRLKSKLLDSSSSTKNDTAENKTNRRVLPKRGDIGVVVEGSDPQHVAIAEAMIIEELASRGYRVVDEAKMKRIKMAAARAQAARYALEGNVEAILRINAHYSAAATIVAHVEAGRPELNEFRLYTGTASAALLAVTSGGRKLGGKTSYAKTVGYTADETRHNALKQAVTEGLSLLF